MRQPTMLGEIVCPQEGIWGWPEDARWAKYSFDSEGWLGADIFISRACDLSEWFVSIQLGADKDSEPYENYMAFNAIIDQEASSCCKIVITGWEVAFVASGTTWDGTITNEGDATLSNNKCCRCCGGNCFKTAQDECEHECEAVFPIEMLVPKLGFNTTTGEWESIGGFTTLRRHDQHPSYPDNASHCAYCTTRTV